MNVTVVVGGPIRVELVSRFHFYFFQHLTHLISHNLIILRYTSLMELF